MLPIRIYHCRSTSTKSGVGWMGVTANKHPPPLTPLPPSPTPPPPISHLRHSSYIRRHCAYSHAVHRTLSRTGCVRCVAGLLRRDRRLPPAIHASLVFALRRRSGTQVEFGVEGGSLTLACVAGFSRRAVVSFVHPSHGHPPARRSSLRRVGGFWRPGGFG